VNPEIRILIADDHPVLRAGLRQAIDGDRSMRVVAEVGDGLSAVELIEALRPDVVVLDIRMPLLDGFGVLREMRKRRLTAPVIFLTLHADESLFYEAIDLGAKGYILKDSMLAAIVDGVRAVAKGQHYVTPALSTFLIKHRVRSEALAARHPGLTGLTPTERRILRLVSTGQSSREIADALFVHYRTIENHRVNIAQKLGLSGHNAVLKFALEHKHEV
jgi:DNA-binding NarL/FixJ family response regulator